MHTIYETRSERVEEGAHPHSTHTSASGSPSPSIPENQPLSQPNPTVSSIEDTVQACADPNLSRLPDPLHSNSNLSLMSPNFVRQLNSTISSAPTYCRTTYGSGITRRSHAAPAANPLACSSGGTTAGSSIFIAPLIQTQAMRPHHCDQCSSSRADLYGASFRLVGPGAAPPEAIPTSQRVCNSCQVILRSGSRIPPIEVPVSIRRTDSQSSVLTECPVCSTRLVTISAAKGEQERHINSCLEGNAFDGARNSSRYLGIVFSLNKDSPLNDQECTICMEEYAEGKGSDSAPQLLVLLPSELHPGMVFKKQQLPRPLPVTLSALAAESSSFTPSLSGTPSQTEFGAGLSLTWAP
ncbi:hypothetical protein L0F63_002753, partial [Massospora cicadina]